MKSFGIFVLFAILIAFNNAAYLKNSNTNNGDKKKKKSKGPKGPADRSEWNEVPFAKSNIKFIEEGSMIEIDNTKIFAANYTFPYQTNNKQMWDVKNHVYRGQDWQNLPNYDYNFENDCALARLKINVVFPAINHYARGGFITLALFLDGERINSASSGYYNEGGAAIYGWKVPIQSLNLSASVFNVLSKSHKIEVKFKNTYYTQIDGESDIYTIPNTNNLQYKWSMDLWNPPRTNLNMYGECIRFKDFNGK